MLSRQQCLLSVVVKPSIVGGSTRRPLRRAYRRASRRTAPARPPPPTSGIAAVPLAGAERAPVHGAGRAERPIGRAGPGGAGRRAARVPRVLARRPVRSRHPLAPPVIRPSLIGAASGSFCDLLRRRRRRRDRSQLLSYTPGRLLPTSYRSFAVVNGERDRARSSRQFAHCCCAVSDTRLPLRYLLGKPRTLRP